MFSFEHKLYVFGGSDNKGASNALKDFYEFSLKTGCWSKLHENDKNSVLLPRDTQSTTVIVSKSGLNQNVYIIGGQGKNYTSLDHCIKFSFTGDQIWWLLHYLDCTEMTGYLSRNVCEQMTWMYQDLKNE